MCVTSEVVLLITKLTTCSLNARKNQTLHGQKRVDIFCDACIADEGAVLWILLSVQDMHVEMCLQQMP